MAGFFYLVFRFDCVWMIELSHSSTLQYTLRIIESFYDVYKHQESDNIVKNTLHFLIQKNVKSSLYLTEVKEIDIGSIRGVFGFFPPGEQGRFLIPLKLDLWGGGEAREVGRWGEFLLTKSYF